MTPAPAFDVAVVGLGPAGRALASRCAALGLSVVAYDRQPDAAWTPTYGIWGDELGALPESAVRVRVTGVQLRAVGEHVLTRDYLVLDNGGLQAALPLTGVTVRRARLGDTAVASLTTEARVVVDARGARPDGPVPADPAPAQTAFGLVLPAAEAAPALQGAPALLLDWRTDWADGTPQGAPTFLYAIPVGDDGVLLEETCLAAAPGMPVADLKARLRRRLVARGVRPAALDSPLGREVVRIPMRGRAMRPPVGTLAAGTSGRAGNLVTGYSVAHALTRSVSLAAEIAAGRTPKVVDRLGPADVLREAGLRALLRLDTSGTLALFDAFGRLPPDRQAGFMSRDSDALGLAGAMWGMFCRMPPRARLQLISATLGPRSVNLNRGGR